MNFYRQLYIPPYLFSMYNHSFNFLYLFFYFARTPYIRMRMCAHNHDVPLTLNKLQWPRTGNTGTLLPGLSWSHMRAESRVKAQNTGKVSCYYQARGSSSNGFFPWPCSTFLSIYLEWFSCRRKNYYSNAVRITVPFALFRLDLSSCFRLVALPFLSYQTRDTV